MVYVNNTEVDFLAIGTTYTEVGEYYEKTGNVPEFLDDIIEITKEENGNIVINWA